MVRNLAGPATTTLLFAALVAAVGSTLIGGGDRASALQGLGPEARLVQSTDPALAEAFGVLRESSLEADAVPEKWVRQFIGSDRSASSMSIGAAHRVDVAAARTTSWVMPASGSVCLIEQSGDAASFGCSEAEAALAGQAISTAAGVGFGLADDQIRVSGLLPDGASGARLVMADGGSREVTILDNVYAAVVTGAPDRLEWTDGNGQMHSVPVPHQQ